MRWVRMGPWKSVDDIEDDLGANFPTYVCISKSTEVKKLFYKHKYIQILYSMNGQMYVYTVYVWEDETPIK